jgi:hypothetical protein
MHRHECNTHNFLFNLENQTKDFSYTIFPVKKNKCGKIFKIMRKSLFKYSFYSKKEETWRREINKNIAAKWSSTLLIGVESSIFFFVG